MKKFLSTSLFLCISFILISELHDLVLGVMASCRDRFDYSLCMVASETTHVYTQITVHIVLHRVIAFIVCTGLSVLVLRLNRVIPF